MAKRAAKKQAAAPICAHCLTDVTKVAVSGQTAVGKNDTMVSFQVCEPCYTEMRGTYGEATKIANLRRRFWEKVKTNAKKISGK